MNIAILDGVVIAVVLISAILAMFRGFVREVLSIAAWVAAAVLAYLFYEQLVPYVSEYIEKTEIAIGVSAAAIFLVSLIIVSLITMKISDFVMDSPVGAIDRLLGFLFGAARGVLLVVVAVIFFNWLVDAENRPAWVTTAATYPELSNLGDRLLAAIPDDPESAIRGAFEGAGEAMQDTGEALEDAAEPADTTLTPQNRNGLDQLIDGSTDDSTVIAPTPAEPVDTPTVGGQN
ncbi:CvpA family protein [Acuticoccus sp. MNP-M23]|uniref:CvpA family protein n=1 Tax=Acuticoccus sp. MNP-M23 TaxID=3072793 RepID=UPI002814CC65|nr:CvpA family protein [Acuticoccus sp. MNP-M23]WMS41263.1 CvpA family protein [Acuticoccus sp. MNP-M23]